MADLIIPTITLAPRVPKGPDTMTVTTNAGVTIFITDEVTVVQTDTIEKTVSILDTSFIHITTTITDTSTTITTSTSATTITETQTLTPPPAPPMTKTLIINSSTSLLPLPTPLSPTQPACVPVGKHVDAFQVLSIVFGVFILVLLALMWFLVRRFYKMYRAERVLRKQLQTEGTEMPELREEGTRVGGGK